jgi:hypothetical protein
VLDRIQSIAQFVLRRGRSAEDDEKRIASIAEANAVNAHMAGVQADAQYRISQIQQTFR